MKDIFPLNRNPYNPRQNFQFSKPRINTVYHGIESISNPGPSIKDLVPSNLKERNELDKFIKSISSENLRILHVDCPKFLCRMSVFWKKLLERSSHRNL